MTAHRRDHGDERAYIDLFENAPVNGGMAKVGCCATNLTLLCSTGLMEASAQHFGSPDALGDELVD